MVRCVYILIDPFGKAKIRARRPFVDPGMTLVVLECEISKGATKAIAVALAEPAVVE